MNTVLPDGYTTSRGFVAMSTYEKYGLSGKAINALNQRPLTLQNRWEPTHPPIHPNCRCVLIPIGDGKLETQLPGTYAEYVKTCGQKQASRFACRGCQYVGECK